MRLRTSPCFIRHLAVVPMTLRATPVIHTTLGDVHGLYDTHGFICSSYDTYDDSHGLCDTHSYARDSHDTHDLARASCDTFGAAPVDLRPSLRHRAHRRRIYGRPSLILLGIRRPSVPACNFGRRTCLQLLQIKRECGFMRKSVGGNE